MKRVYLDQCHWIALEKAARGKGSAKANEALDVLRYGVERGFVSLPLSAVHYMETYQRPTGRQSLASIMAEMSRFHTIVGPPDVLPAELDAYLHRRYGKPTVPRVLKVFGRGVGFAFGENFGTFRVRDDLDLAPGQRSQVQQAGQEALEFWALAGPPDGVPIPGWDENNGYRAFGERQLAHERTLASSLAEEGRVTPRRIHDWVAATEVMDIVEPLNDAFARAGLTTSETSDLDSADGMTALLRALPSRDVVFDLRRLRHADRSARWEANDLNDLAALSVALPYCDIVVTEKQWRHLAEQAGIPTRYETIVLDKLGDLPMHLI